MRLTEHLVELRKRLMISALAIIVAATAGWLLADSVWDLLRVPISEVAAADGRLASIAYTDVTGAFDLKLRISIFLAIFIGSPIWLYQIWAFFSPGLTRKEKLGAVAFLAAAVPLFLGGAIVAWYLLPNIVRLLTSFGSAEDALLLDARTYLNFATRLMFAVGIGFVLPVFIVLLNFVGVLSAATILRSWRVAVLIIAVFAAMTTPAADISSMLLLGGAMCVLYFLAAGICYLHDRRKHKKLAAELAEYELS
ncbi:twin-arginine translocase subunit TatC [Leucobacter sp. OH2974_COT-288]|nr:twin-arginine translocase subunit TatC [Canibacter oris]RRD36782.1 twin-arginine translocase subunit TatC [Leucobacter sp. OH2974_COT-288]